MSQEEREVYATVHAAQVRQRQLGKSEQPQADGCQQIKLYHSVLGAGEPESPIDPDIFAQVLESPPPRVSAISHGRVPKKGGDAKS